MMKEEVSRKGAKVETQGAKKKGRGRKAFNSFAPSDRLCAFA
jgi:hypothetical protein